MIVSTHKNPPLFKEDSNEHTSMAHDILVMPMVKVAIVTSQNIIDMTLPAQIPLFDVIPSLRYLISSDEVITINSHIRLASLHGAVFNDDATLESLGIIDGDMLLLQEKPVGVTASPIIEDIADTAALFAHKADSWNRSWLRNFLIMSMLIFLLSLACTAYLFYQRSSWLAWQNILSAVYEHDWLRIHYAQINNDTGAIFHNYRFWISGTVLMLAILTGGFLTYVCAKKRGVLRHYVIPSSCISIAFAFCIEHILLVHEPLIVHVIVMGTLGFVWGCVLLIIDRLWVALWTTQTTLCLIVTLLAALTLFWHYDGIAFGALAIVIAFFMFSTAGSLATIFARFPLPYLPAPGESIPSALSAARLVELPQKIEYARSYSYGLIATGVILQTLGSIVEIFNTYSHPQYLWLSYILVIMAACSAVHRQRLWQLPWAKLWFIAAPSIIAMGLAVFSASEIQTVVCLIIAVLYLSIVYLVYTKPYLNDVRNYPIILRRIVNLVIFCCDCLILPIGMCLIGVFEWALYR